MSKVICTGLRVAYLAFGEPFCDRIRHGIYNMNMKTSSLNVEVITELIKSGEADHLLRQKEESALSWGALMGLLPRCLTPYPIQNIC